MDDADRSTERQEMQMALFEKQRKESFAPVVPVHYIACRYCNETKPRSLYPYCDDDCEQDDIRLTAAKKRNGKL